MVTRTTFNLDHVNLNFLKVPGFRVYCCGQPTISGFEAALPYHNRTSQEGAEQESLSTTLKKTRKSYVGGMIYSDFMLNSNFIYQPQLLVVE